MEISIYLARVFGIYLVVACVAMFVNRRYVSRVAKDFADNLGLVFFSGFIHLFLGLLVVVYHNIWSWDFRGVVTFIGWVGVFKGVIRIFSPAKFVRLGEEFTVGKKLILWGIGWLAVGIYLVWAGFFM